MFNNLYYFKLIMHDILHEMCWLELVFFYYMVFKLWQPFIFAFRCIACRGLICLPRIMRFRQDPAFLG
jgi:hypothetical protein